MSQKKQRPWHQDPKFLKLRKKWYDKLAKDGFQDSEIVDWRNGEAGNLLKGHGNYTSQGDYIRNWSPAQERYFTALRQRSFDMLEEGRDATEAEAVRLIGEGESYAHTAKLLGISQGRIKALVEEQIRVAAWEVEDGDEFEEG